jgi:curved DNA-binding protein CbpA
VFDLDLYAQLGVSPDATEVDLRAAWRDRAFALHPDRNPGSDGFAFRQAAEAWSILSDAGQRARYDQMRGGLVASPRPPAPPVHSPWESRGWAQERQRQEAHAAWRHEELRQAQAAARRRQYEADQAADEESFCVLGEWTRDGTMRNGGVGRRRW